MNSPQRILGVSEREDRTLPGRLKVLKKFLFLSCSHFPSPTVLPPPFLFVLLLGSEESRGAVHGGLSQPEASSSSYDSEWEQN